MKKTITSTLLLVFVTGSVLLSQEMRSVYKEASMYPAKSEVITGGVEKNSTKPITMYGAPGDTLWKENFGTTTTGGIPAGWVASGANMLWRKTTKVTYSNLCYGGSSDKLHSTTEMNGTLIFDGDSANKAAASGACGTNTQKVGSVTTGAINLAGNPEVVLKFQHRFRLCCSVPLVKLTVSVSGDGGATFTNLPDARGAVSLNQNPLNNPGMYVANISAIAGNKTDVRIRFTFDNTSLGVYYWELDDIAIVKSWDHDLILTKAITDFYYRGGGYYTQTPLKQAGPFVSFRGIVLNQGANVESNVKLNVDIKNGTTGVYNQNSPLTATYAKYLLDTLELVTPSYTPTAKGVYTSTFNATGTLADGSPADNMVVKLFEINDTVYARDDGIITSSTIMPSNYVGGNFDGSMLANVYEMNANDVATSISVYLGSNTNSSSAIYAHIFKRSATGIIGTTPLVSSGLYDISDSTTDAGKWVTLPLIKNGGEMLVKDSTYIVAIESVSESTKKIRISSDLITEQPNVTSYVKTTGGTTPGWGWITVQPRIRLNLKGLGVGMNEVAENGVSLKQNMPNPFEKHTLIGYEISKASNVKLEIYDIAGKLVLEQIEGTVSAGKHSLVIDRSFEPGVYFYTLVVDRNKVTKKMTVTK